MGWSSYVCLLAVVFKVGRYAETLVIGGIFPQTAEASSSPWRDASACVLAGFLHVLCVECPCRSCFTGKQTRMTAVVEMEMYEVAMLVWNTLVQLNPFPLQRDKDRDTKDFGA